MSSIESVILSNLLLKETYTRRVAPYLKEEYFKEQSEKLIFKKFSEHFLKYNLLPSKKELEVELGKTPGLNEGIYRESLDLLGSFSRNEVENEQWLLDQTEQFCQDRAIYNALLKSIEIADDKTGKHQKTAIPALLTDALSISFDSHIGHDYLEDAEYRWEFYHTLEKKIPFDLHYLNKITSGGLVPKTLTVLMAGTGGGKSLGMCHMAAAHLSMGYNVLYLTMEMAEERIAERNDANLLDIDIQKLPSLDKETFLGHIQKIKNKTSGKLLIKEYPNGQATAAHFRHLLQELKIKKTFKPDIIYVDYLNICASSRLKRGSTNSYEYIKSIAEELRALGQEFDLPVMTATQVNRDGLDNSDIDLKNTSDSVGLPFTADLMIGMVQNEQMAERNQMLFIQLKNRYNDLNNPKRFIIGVDKPKMRFFDVEESAQKGITGGPVPEEQKLQNIANKFDGFE